MLLIATMKKKYLIKNLVLSAGKCCYIFYSDVQFIYDDRTQRSHMQIRMEVLSPNRLSDLFYYSFSTQLLIFSISQNNKKIPLILLNFFIIVLWIVINNYVFTLLLTLLHINLIFPTILFRKVWLTDPVPVW